jgi:hypothetical protein
MTVPPILVIKGPEVDLVGLADRAFKKALQGGTVPTRESSLDALPRDILSLGPAAVVIDSSLRTDHRHARLTDRAGLKLALELRIDRALRFSQPIYIASVENLDVLTRASRMAAALLAEKGSGFLDMVAGTLWRTDPLPDGEWDEVQARLRIFIECDLWEEIRAARHYLRTRFAVVNSDLEPLRNGGFGRDDVALAKASLFRGEPLERALSFQLNRIRIILERNGLDQRYSRELRALEALLPAVSNSVAGLIRASEDGPLHDLAALLHSQAVAIMGVLNEIRPEKSSAGGAR